MDADVRNQIAKRSIVNVSKWACSVSLIVANALNVKTLRTKSKDAWTTTTSSTSLQNLFNELQ